jgi:LysR family transcriptional regulator, nitrogen assimilation regulatory protein
MNLRQLKYFIGVADAGNMTRAAETLHVAQTALSTQIRQLEEDLKVTLLFRHSRGVEPTQAGRLLYARGVALLKQVEEIRRDVAATDGDGIELVRFGITPALMLSLGPDLIKQLQDSVANISLRLVEAMSHVMVESVLADQLDYALCYDAPDKDWLERTVFLQEQLVCVAQPGRWPDRNVALADVLDETLAMPEAADTVRLVVAKAAREIGAELKVAYEVRSISAMKGLARRGTAVCILPFAAVADEVAGATLAAHPIVMPTVMRTLYLVASAQRPRMRCDAAVSLAVRTSLDRLIELLGPLAHAVRVNANQASVETDT